MISDISRPAVEPVTLDYAKTFLRVDHDDDDALISDLITSARLRIETLIGGSLIMRPRRLVSTHISGRGVFINHHPVTAINRISICGAASECVEISPDSYSANLRCQPPAVTVNAPGGWRGLLSGATHIEVEFTAGFGEAAEDIPMPLRQAVMLLLAQSYEYRGDREDGLPPIPMMVDALIMPYRNVRL